MFRYVIVKTQAFFKDNVFLKTWREAYFNIIQFTLKSNEQADGYTM